MMPKEQRDNIAALERVQRESPDMAELIDARLAVLRERIEKWQDPAGMRDEALVSHKYYTFKF